MIIATRLVLVATKIDIIGGRRRKLEFSVEICKYTVIFQTDVEKLPF